MQVDLFLTDRQSSLSIILSFSSWLCFASLAWPVGCSTWHCLPWWYCHVRFHKIPGYVQKYTQNEGRVKTEGSRINPYVGLALSINDPLGEVNSGYMFLGRISSLTVTPAEWCRKIGFRQGKVGPYSTESKGCKQAHSASIQTPSALLVWNLWFGLYSWMDS